MNGNGTFFWQDGDKYVGQFKADKSNGFGEYFFKKGDYYMGMFKDWQRSGIGAHGWSNGDQYVGMWMQDKPNGFGVKRYNASGDRYEGHFKDFLFHGPGTATFLACSSHAEKCIAISYCNI
jgi:hypothetical protein